ncbi:hypothetical protein M409DRAFT_63672 [Zasmidium cellare ATCC 36951]|uniref:Major facilitator superfamily (MFS) profile domain-containing protein n=1 Tax=Zasmidium cellare ATCC 36951 TaxID=1080233 RepID=A0A6A6CW67_ZASCE|nr:uncharacterized protein M409DRAFT_63672 [Zasmidium cellare ATCC 36951]KAF2171351.1 hypothetical protein M409DRAFT_63672 [Zasmidium cellare ATCC 36951]
MHATFPAWIPQRSSTVRALLILTSIVTSTTLGYDGSMMNGLNILPSYTDYFALNTTTTALNTASVWVGGCLCIVYSRVPDWIGRKWALFYGAVITIIGVILQAAAQNVGMFVFARFLTGFGTGATAIAVPVYLSETLPVNYRAWGLGLVYDAWYIGGLIASGTTYGTANFQSTWAWRLPSLLQGVFSVLCIVMLFLTPESPRWLQSKGRTDEAVVALAQTHSNGVVSDPAVQHHLREIIETLEFEKFHKPLAIKAVVSDPSSRKRIFLAGTVAVCTMLSGNNIVSYYLGTMLDQAGITDSTTQLEINVILNAWCLCVAIGGTFLCDRMGRKSMAILSTLLCAIMIFIVGALTKLYGTSTYTPGVYGTVAAIFLFQGSYSVGWTPLSVLYPPEVLNYNIRSVGMGIYTFLANGSGLLVTFAFPFALDDIGWKTYMINGVWDFVQIAVVFWTWVETKGRTLEQIDESLDGQKVEVMHGLDPESLGGKSGVGGWESDEGKKSKSGGVAEVTAVG